MKQLQLATLAGVALASVLTLGSGSARAADMALKAPPPPPPPAYSWTGCYVDAGFGYALWNQDHYFEAGPPVTPGFVELTSSQTNGGRGWLGRFGGGCDYQIGSFLGGSLVVGVLADYDFKSVSGTWSDVAGFVGNEKETGSWVVGPRIGLASASGILGYVDGGYTQARFGSFGLITGTCPCVALPFNVAAQTYSGAFLGGGTEMALSSWLSGLPTGLFLRTEYRYSSFKAYDVPILDEPSGALTGAYEHATKDEQSITTSLVWRFNWTGPVTSRY